MYRPGFGDCFLLSFLQSGQERHMLIDCGVFQGTAGAEKTMQDIARHIRKTTGGRLDVVVATHEHWDHLSGFVQAQAIFDRIKFKQIWLAWTEDPTNPAAVRLRQERALAIHTLRSAMQLAPESATAQGILDFFGAPVDPNLAASASGARLALDYLVGRDEAVVSYCQPGEPPRTLAGMPGVRFFVLGPPTSEAALHKTEAGKKSAEGYGLGEQIALINSLSAAIQQAQGFSQAGAGSAQDFPFDAQFQVSLEHARQDAFFIENYGFGEAPAQGEAWRRIERDWLGVTSELALRLDQATNNTSLVLAIELVDSGRVLLFPGDAQIGSWLSWMDLSWEVAGVEGERQTVRGEDLIIRTALYKAAHHGSHNATLREHGLERMQSPHLTAMLPVERGLVERRDWNMPFPALYQRLLEKTRGRLLRLDDGVPAAAPEIDQGMPLLTGSEWKAFKRQTAEQRLYIDYFLD